MKQGPLPGVSAPTVPQLLRDGASTYEERNRTYGNNYKEMGHLLELFFPNGIPAMDADGWNRFGLWMMVLVKITRYANQLQQGGHKDSAHDMMVYAAMLEELTA